LLTAAHRPKALHRRRLVLLVLLVICLTLLGSTSFFREGLSHLLAALQTQVADHPVRGAVLFVLYAALGAMLAFVSSSVLVPVAIYAWGEEMTFLLLWIGWLAGGMASYGIGRFLGRLMRRRLTSAGQIAAYERRIGAKAGIPLVFLFQLAMPSEIPGYVLGLLRYRFTLYLLILALAELPYAIGVTYLGGALINGQMIRFALVALAGIALLAYAFRHLNRLLEEADRRVSAAIDANADDSARTP
jgi:uncharacterized membrane protein YdjX (TVP38/TMEM64 family)